MPDALKLAEIKRVDLNCVLFFVAYMKYRKISTVSSILGCSDATVSIMLQRFSLSFSQAVFERKSRTLSPTEFAWALNKKCEAMINLSCDVFLNPCP
jgi:DNA-binding transcriptional LysR family regulator